MPFQTENVCVGKCHPHHLLEVGKDFTSSSVKSKFSFKFPKTYQIYEKILEKLFNIDIFFSLEKV